MKYFFEFFPIIRAVNKAVIIEMCVGQVALARRVLTSKGWWANDYHNGLCHKTMEAATARDRGCEYRISGPDFFYTEKQGGTSADDMVYCTFNHYISTDYIPTLCCGDTVEKFVIIKEQDTRKMLREWGHSFAVIGPNGFDGTNCRECGCSAHMSEPDGLKDDNLFTCWSCKDRFKCLGTWEDRLKEYEK